MGKARQLADAVNALQTKSVTFLGTAGRIYADFSNGVTPSRTLFQTTSVDAITNVGAIPNGVGTSARMTVFGNSDPTNASSLNISQISNTESRIVAGRQGTGAYCPLTFYLNNAEAVRFDLSGNVGVNTTTPNLSSSAKAITVSAGTSGDVVGVVELQGSRTANGGNFCGFHFYHQATKVSSITSSRGANGDEGQLRFWSKPTAGSILVKGVLDSDGSWYFGGDMGLDFMRIVPGVGVALGTNGTAPTATLHVSTNQGASKLLNDYGTGAFGLYSQTPTAGLGMTSRILMGYSDVGAFAAIGADYEAFGGTTAGGGLVFGTGTNGRSSITAKMRLNRYGNLGLGGDPLPPSTSYLSFNVGPDSYMLADKTSAPNTSFNLSQNAAYTADAWAYIQTYKATCYVQNDGAHIFKFAPSGTAGTAITWTEAGRFTNTGKLQHMGLEFKSVALGSVSGAVSIDLATANEFTATIAGATTFAFTNAPSGNFGQEVTLRLTNPGASPLAWPASTKYPGGTLGTLTAAGTDILKVRYDKTTSTYIVAALWKDVK